MNIVYTINNIFHHHSTSQELNIIRHQLLTLFFDNYFLQHSTPASLSNNIEKSCHMTAFFVILRQISPKTSRLCEKCCRFMSKYIVKKNCCRKLPSKNVGEKCCQNILSKKTVIDSVFRQILTKNLKNFVECSSILAKNVVEKNCCRKKLLSNFMIRHHFQTAFFDKKFCRKMRSKNVVERSWYNLSKNTVKKYCRKIPSKNVC